MERGIVALEPTPCCLPGILRLVRLWRVALAVAVELVHEREQPALLGDELLLLGQQALDVSTYDRQWIRLHGLRTIGPQLGPGSIRTEGHYSCQASGWLCMALATVAAPSIHASWSSSRRISSDSLSWKVLNSPA